MATGLASSSLSVVSSAIVEIVEDDGTVEMPMRGSQSCVSATRRGSPSATAGKLGIVSATRCGSPSAISGKWSIVSATRCGSSAAVGKLSVVSERGGSQNVPVMFTLFFSSGSGFCFLTASLAKHTDMGILLPISSPWKSFAILATWLTDTTFTSAAVTFLAPLLGITFTLFTQSDTP